jgi:asparagine synthase (glutamine-hydrolysing)
MCGICGVVTRPGEAPDAGLVRAMAASLAHRGPDAEGFLFDGNVGLGHRRLTIIDTSEAANQPLANEDGGVAVIYNGEIYNFQELTGRLAAAGHRFRTRSDTEVLVHGWEEWGAALPQHLRGMFAFALYDRRAGRLFIARDRLGKKPLYYSLVPGGFAFASEIKALLLHPGVSRGLDLAAVGEYMAYGNVAGERSVYRHVRRLPPGCALTLETANGSGPPSIAPYWDFRPRPRAALDEEEWLDRLDSTLAESVRLRMIADVPLGAFLSGGVDSSLVVSHMARLAPGRVETFCIGFEEAGWDESSHAAAVADFLGTDHRLERVTPDAAAILPELVAAYDEPFADPSAVPTYYVAQMTRRHVKVALSGDGGDELFAGYRRYQETRALDLLGTLATPAGRRLARGLAGRLPPGAYLRRALDRASRRGFDLYHHALGWSDDHLSLLAPEVRQALGTAQAQKAAADFARFPDLPFLDRCRYTDLLNYLPDQILVKVDRASMRHALEVRCPLLDQEVLEVAAEAPMAAQMSWRRGKTLLRKLACRHLPAALVDRPKQGFAVPLGRWLRGPLAPLVENALDDAASPTWSFFRRDEARRRFDLHRAGRADAEKVLWRLLFFHAWAERSLD